MTGLTANVAGLLFEQPVAVGSGSYTLSIETKLPGWFDGAPVRRTATNRMWAHGRFSERGWRDARMITFEGFIFCTDSVSAAAAQRAVTGILGDGTAGTCSVTDPILGTLTATVFLAATPKCEPLTDLTWKYQIQFELPDPRKYGVLTSLTTAPAAPGGGLSLDLFTQNTLGILDFGAVGAAGTVTFTNTGTADAAPVFTVRGAATGFTITERTSGNQLIYGGTGGTVPSGQNLVLSAIDGSVVLAGQADRSTYLSGRGWTFPASGATVTYLFEPTGSDGSTQLTVGVASAWW